MINELRKNIKLLLQEIEQVQEVREYNAIEFSGFPAISVTLSEHENDFETSSENMRVFAFRIRCFVSLANEIKSVTEDKWQRSERVMSDVIWRVINKLDAENSSNLLGGDATFLEAAPSTWGQVTMQNGVCLMGEVVLRVHQSKDVIS